MNNFRLSRGLRAVIGDSLRGSHATLDALFISSGAPGEPPAMAHGAKWKEWLFRAGQDPNTDSLQVLGNVLEEFMDVEPIGVDEEAEWRRARARVEVALEADGLEYYRGGRVIPNGTPAPERSMRATTSNAGVVTAPPSSVQELLDRIVRGLPRAIHPLAYRRRGAQSLSFSSEYDVQDLLHALMRPWIVDIRAEEFVPSYAGSNTRMDFLLPQHEIVLETKFVRNVTHARKIGDELIIDIKHYCAHPSCKELWCVIYDEMKLIKNVSALESDLAGRHEQNEKSIDVKVVVI